MRKHLTFNFTGDEVHVNGNFVTIIDYAPLLYFHARPKTYFDFDYELFQHGSLTIVFTCLSVIVVDVFYGQFNVFEKNNYFPINKLIV